MCTKILTYAIYRPLTYIFIIKYQMTHSYEPTEIIVYSAAQHPRALY